MGGWGMAVLSPYKGAELLASTSRGHPTTSSEMDSIASPWWVRKAQSPCTDHHPPPRWPTHSPCQVLMLMCSCEVPPQVPPLSSMSPLSITLAFAATGTSALVLREHRANDGEPMDPSGL